MKRRKVAFLLAGAILMSQLGYLKSVNITGTEVVAAASETQEENKVSDGEFNYVLNEDGTAELQAYTGSSKDVIIPNQVEKDGIVYKVTKVENGSCWFHSDLESIVIPEGVTEIGDNAFDTCFNLKSVTLPESLVRIGDMAFNACNIENLKLGKNVNYIGRCAFQFSPLDNLEIASNIEIGEYAFNGCKKANNLKIDGNVEKVDFYNLSIFKAIEIDPFNQSYRKIDKTIYNNNLTEAEYCDRNVSGIVNLPGSLKKINDGCFANCSLSQVNINGNISSIGNSAFYGCSNLKKINIPESVNSIGMSAFEGCSNLENIQLPKGLKCIEERAFDNCKSLKDIIIPEGVTEIKNNAFGYCESVENVVLPKSLEHISYFVFDNCKSLSYIEIPENVTNIEEFAFKGCDLKEAKIDNGSVKLGRYVFDWNVNLDNIEFMNCKDINIDVNDPVIVKNYVKVILKAPDSMEVQYVKKGKDLKFDSKKYDLYESGQAVTNLTVNEDKTYDLKLK